MINHIYEIDYPPRGKDKYLRWVRSIADALQAPAELRRLASYDNVYSTTPIASSSSPSTLRRTRPRISTGRKSG